MTSFAGTSHRSDTDTAVPTRAVAQVRAWLAAADPERSSLGQRVLNRALTTEGGLRYLTALVDGVVLPEDPVVAAAALRRARAGAREFLPAPMAWAMALGAWLAPLLPRLVVGLARRAVRALVGHLLLDARPRKLNKGLRRLRAEGFDVNVNLLGEAVLGREQAARRLEQTRQLIANPQVDYVSLKVSAAVAPHSPWDVTGAVREIVQALEPLYRAAGHGSGTFVNLDMEEYRDLDITVAVFSELMAREELRHVRAGIVLQAYLPESAAALETVQRVAQRRVEAGGAPLRVRLVKGANLPMEHVEADLRGWTAAPWGSKVATDAHFKRLLDRALSPQSVRSLEVGVAGHNLFDVAYAWELARERGVQDAVQFEMLLGMATEVVRAVAADVGPIRLYTPVVAPGEFDVALAYLVRRLEEVANPHNFLSRLATLETNVEHWRREEGAFRRACELAARAPVTDSRRQELPDIPSGFFNCPDTDPALEKAREWGGEVLHRARTSELGAATLAAAHVDRADALAELVARAHQTGQEWGKVRVGLRAHLLERVALALEENRGQLLEVMASETGKTLDQGDPEVSEAIDFARYYAASARRLHDLPGARHQPRALTVVTPPWNFPVAIPVGSTLAALAAGSAVVLKPAPEARRTSAVIVDILRSAGVSEDLVRLVDLDTERLGEALITDPRVDQVILTGAYETAQRFLTARPDLRLFAETSGKNAMVVMPSADVDLAVRDAVASAFGHAGQKCSAASLLILVGSVADSPRLHRQLRDAVQSLRVGPAVDPSSQMSRTIAPPTSKLLRGLTELEPGETWWVEPRQLDTGEWSPGVRGWVQPGSFMHRVECFGPVLGVMRARDLSHALELVNAVDYGLTSGLHTLDQRDMDDWVAGVHAGNLYINRGTTGAIVQRQPFGGWKRSVVGPTVKAGGPHYVASLTGWTITDHEATAPDQALRPGIVGLVQAAGKTWVRSAAMADAQAWAEIFSHGHDPSGLASEANIYRYVPTRAMVRCAQGDVAGLARVCIAMVTTGLRGEVSTPTLLPRDLVSALEGAQIAVTVESAEVALDRCRQAGIDRVRVVGEVEPEWGGHADMAIYDAPVSAVPELELLPFVREQTISITTHRYGEPFGPATTLARRLLARDEQ